MPSSLSAVKRNHFKTKIIILNMNVAMVMCVPHILSNHTLTFVRSHTDDDDDNETRYRTYSRLLVYCPYLKFSLCLDAKTRWTGMSADRRIRQYVGPTNEGQVDVFVWHASMKKKRKNELVERDLRFHSFHLQPTFQMRIIVINYKMQFFSQIRAFSIVFRYVMK